MVAFSPRYDAALVLAAQAHQGQLRKGTNIPYITHVVHVATILQRHGFADDLVLAGLLHDVVEDSDVPLGTIADHFGQHVADLVAAVSEQKSDTAGAERPWEERKAEKLALLRAGNPEIAALKAADAIHNARTTSADLRRHGQAVWERFKRGATPTLWYYREILAAVQALLGNHPIADELGLAVAELENLVLAIGKSETVE